MEKQELTVLKIEDLRPFPGNPFHLVEDEQLMELSESIKEFGMAAPILTRPAEDGNGYEVIAGQRRVRASELAGIENVPAFVLPIDRDRAIITLVDSNIQRESILPSERAFAYKMKLDAMKRQGKRTDLTSVPLAQKSQGKTSRQLLGEQVGESQDQIRRYIRLTELITPILDMVDSGKIAIRPAVELSYLPKEQQTILLDTMQLEDCTPSHAQAIKMRKFADEGRLNEDVILSILSEEKGNQKEQFRMPKERISKYFSPGTPAKQMEDTIVKALELYRKRERSKDRER